MRALTTEFIDEALKAWMDGPYGDALRKAYSKDAPRHPMLERIQKIANRVVIEVDK